MIEQFKKERDAFLATLDPRERLPYAIGYGPYSRWCALAGVEPERPNLADPYIAGRFRQYQTWKRSVLAKIAPEAWPSVEPHMTPFLDWLLSVEGEEEHAKPQQTRKKKTK